MKPVFLAALVVVCVAVAMAGEERHYMRCKTNSQCARYGMCCKWGKCRRCMTKRCRSDSECGHGKCCRSGRCYSTNSRMCVKYCSSEKDCNEGQCCLKYYSSYMGRCLNYLQEGDRCCKKSYWPKRSCGCGEGLECQVKKNEFHRHHYRPGKCVVTEGSGDMQFEL